MQIFICYHYTLYEIVKVPFFSYTDEDLIKGCIDNNRKSQELLYKKYFPKMAMLCRKYTTEDDVSGVIINDAFLSVFKNIDKFQQKGSFEGWIRKITFNTLADYFRKENKQIKFLTIEDHVTTSNLKENSILEYEDLLAKVDKLQGTFKDVFVKFSIEGYNHKEIGEELHISEGTSKWYLSEARKKLQNLISPNNKFKNER